MNYGNNSLRGSTLHLTILCNFLPARLRPQLANIDRTSRNSFYATVHFYAMKQNYTILFYEVFGTTRATNRRDRPKSL